MTVQLDTVFAGGVTAGGFDNPAETASIKAACHPSFELLYFATALQGMFGSDIGRFPVRGMDWSCDSYYAIDAGFANGCPVSDQITTQADCLAAIDALLFIISPAVFMPEATGEYNRISSYSYEEVMAYATRDTENVEAYTASTMAPSFCSFAWPVFDGSPLSDGG